MVCVYAFEHGPAPYTVRTDTHTGGQTETETESREQRNRETYDKAAGGGEEGRE